VKICLINTTPFWGGGEKWFVQNAIFLAKEGFTVYMLANKAGPLWSKLSRVEGIHLNHLEVSNLSFLNPKKKWALRSFFARKEISTVIMNSSPEVKLCAPAAKKAAVRNIIYRRGSAIAVKASSINKALYGKTVNHIIANSEATKATFLKHLSHEVASDKVTIIPNGIEMPPQVSIPDTKDFTIGTLGRLVHQKGIDLALETAQFLKQQGVSFKWLIAGAGDDKEMLQAQIEELELGDQVELLGEVSNLNKFFGAIDLYVHTARWEGFGFAIAEAMAYEKAVVAFDISSNPELVIHNETGVLVAMDHCEEMATEIARLRDQKNKLATLGEAGRQRIEEGFTLQKQQGKLLRFLQTI